MIKEAYCSYEVSELLKEKGFNEVVHAYHNIFDKVNLDFNVSGHAPHLQIPCPTHQMAMAWLREIHNIDICVFPYQIDYIGYSYEVKIYKNKELYLTIKDSKTYEEAVEIALKYILNII